MCDSRGGGGLPVTTGRSHAIWLDKGLSSSVYKSFRYLERQKKSRNIKKKNKNILHFCCAPNISDALKFDHNLTLAGGTHFKYKHSKIKVGTNMIWFLWKNKCVCVCVCVCARVRVCMRVCVHEYMCTHTWASRWWQFLPSLTFCKMWKIYGKSYTKKLQQYWQQPSPPDLPGDVILRVFTLIGQSTKQVPLVAQQSETVSCGYNKGKYISIGTKQQKILQLQFQLQGNLAEVYPVPCHEVTVLAGWTLNTNK